MIMPHEEERKEQMREKITKLLDEFTTEEMLKKVYEHTKFLLIHIQK